MTAHPQRKSERPWHDKGRSIRLTPQAVKALEGHRKTEDDERLKLGNVWKIYCCPTAANPPPSVLGVLNFLRDLQVKKRADERTRTADPISLRVRFVPLYLGGKALTYCETGSQRIPVFCPITPRLV